MYVYLLYDLKYEEISSTIKADLKSKTPFFSFLSSLNHRRGREGSHLPKLTYYSTVLENSHKVGGGNGPLFHIFIFAQHDKNMNPFPACMYLKLQAGKSLFMIVHSMIKASYYV